MKPNLDIDKIFDSVLRKAEIEYKQEYWERLEVDLNLSKERKFLIRESLILIVSAAMVIGIFVNSSRVKIANYSQDRLIIEEVSEPVNKELYNNMPHINSLKSQYSDKNSLKITSKGTTVKLQDFQQNKKRYTGSEILEHTNTKYHHLNDNISDKSLMNIKSHAFFEPFTLRSIGMKNFILKKEFSKFRKEMNMRIPSQYLAWRLYLDPYGEFQNYSRRISQLPNPDEKETEFALSSMGYGINVRLTKGSWSIVTGLGISQIREKVNYTQKREVTNYDSTLKVIKWNYGTTPSGTNLVLVNWQVDSSTSLIEESVCATCITKFTYLTLPLELQYELPLGRIRPFFGAGVNMGLLINAKGYYATDAGITRLSTSDVELNKVMMSAKGITGLRTRLWHNMDLSISYEYRYGVNSMLKSYQQKADLQVLRLGFSIPLN